MDDIEALLNGAPDDEEGGHVLADSLRSKRRAADWFSLSTIPQLSNLGKRSGARVNAQARSIGTNSRISRLAKTRRAQELSDFERDRGNELADRELEWKRKLGEDAATRQGKMQLQELKNEDGGGSYSSGVYKQRETPSGMPFGIASDNSVQGPYGNYYRSAQEMYDKNPELLERSKRQANERYRSKKFSESRGEGEGDRFIERMESLDTMSNMSSGYGRIVDAIDKGAWTGKVSDVFPTFRSASAYFESAAAELGLENLKKYKLTPVSDKDLKYVMSASVPSLPPEEMKAWALHKIEATQRLRDAEIMVLKALDDNAGKMPQGSERRALDREIDQIVNGGDFKFEDPFSGDREATKDGFVSVEDLNKLSTEELRRRAKQ